MYSMSLTCYILNNWKSFMQYTDNKESIRMINISEGSSREEKAGVKRWIFKLEEIHNSGTEFSFLTNKYLLLWFSSCCVFTFMKEKAALGLRIELFKLKWAWLVLLLRNVGIRNIFVSYIFVIKEIHKAELNVSCSLGYLHQTWTKGI